MRKTKDSEKDRSFHDRCAGGYNGLGSEVYHPHARLTIRKATHSGRQRPHLPTRHAGYALTQPDSPPEEAVGFGDADGKPPDAQHWFHTLLHEPFRSLL